MRQSCIKSTRGLYLAWQATLSMVTVVGEQALAGKRLPRSMAWLANLQRLYQATALSRLDQMSMCVLREIGCRNFAVLHKSTIKCSVM